MKISLTPFVFLQMILGGLIVFVFSFWWNNIFEETLIAPTESVGTIQSISGEVKSRKVFGANWNGTKNQQAVSYFDRIRTGRDGSVEISLSDGGSLSLTESSLAVLAPSSLELQGNVDVDAGIGALKTPTGVIEFNTREIDYVD